MSDRPLEDYSLPYLWKRIEELKELAEIRHRSLFRKSDLLNNERIRNDRAAFKIQELEALLDEIASLYRTCDADWCGKSGPDSECFACKVGHILAKREQT
jgi:hypothetical protein